jgi:hypothetical protein
MKLTLSMLTVAFATLFSSTFAYAAYHNVFRRDGTIECCDVVHDGLGAGGGPSASNCTSGTCGRYNEEEVEELASREGEPRDARVDDDDEVEEARASRELESRLDERGDADEEEGEEEGEEEDEVDAAEQEGPESREGRESGTGPDRAISSGESQQLLRTRAYLTAQVTFNPRRQACRVTLNARSTRNIYLSAPTPSASGYLTVRNADRVYRTRPVSYGWSRTFTVRPGSYTAWLHAIDGRRISRRVLSQASIRCGVAARNPRASKDGRQAAKKVLRKKGDSMP